MAVDSVVEGKQYLYTGIGEGGIRWFQHGSIITITRDDGSKIPHATGPAREDDVGGSGVKKGEIVQGYARLESLQEIKCVYTVSFNDEPVTVYNTVINAGRKLTQDEKDAIQRIIDQGV